MTTVNKKKWPNSSEMFIRSFKTRQRGFLYWNETHYMWKGHIFQANSYDDARHYVHAIDKKY
jgi:hypothetical protein